MIRRPRPLYPNLYYRHHTLTGNTIPPLHNLLLLLQRDVNNVTRRRIYTLHHLLRHQTKHAITKGSRPRPLTKYTRRLNKLRRTLYRQRDLSPLRGPPLNRQCTRYPHLFQIRPTHPKRIRPMARATCPILYYRQRRHYPNKPPVQGDVRHRQLPNTTSGQLCHVKRQPNRNVRHPPSLRGPLQPRRNRQTNTSLHPGNLRGPKRTGSVIPIMINRTSNIHARRIRPNTTNNNLNTLTTIRRRTIPTTLYRHNNRNTL